MSKSNGTNGPRIDLTYEQLQVAIASMDEIKEQITTLTSAVDRSITITRQAMKLVKSSHDEIIERLDEEIDPRLDALDSRLSLLEP